MFTLALTRNCLELCDIQLEGLDLANPLLLSEAFLSISINDFFLA
jgi:hypothetical protein